MSAMKSQIDAVIVPAAEGRVRIDHPDFVGLTFADFGEAMDALLGHEPSEAAPLRFEML